MKERRGGRSWKNDSEAELKEGEGGRHNAEAERRASKAKAEQTGGRQKAEAERQRRCLKPDQAVSKESRTIRGAEASKFKKWRESEAESGLLTYSMPTVGALGRVTEGGLIMVSVSSERNRENELVPEEKRSMEVCTVVSLHSAAS